MCILECIFTLTLITLCCNVWRKKHVNINFKIFTRTWKCHAKLWSCYEYYFYIIYFRLTGLVICHVMFLLRHNVSSVSFMMFICFVFCLTFGISVRSVGVEYALYVIDAVCVFFNSKYRSFQKESMKPLQSTISVFYVNLLKT